MEKDNVERIQSEEEVERSTDVVLPTRFPVPSNDPNDPLNWSLPTKIVTYLTICLFTFIANVNGSNFTVAIVPLKKHFRIDATHATLLVGLNVLMFGVGNLIWVPLMRVIGKRPVYLIALAILTAANAWSTVATTWGSLLGGRMISGVGAAAADATVPSVVADMFFLEQRGHCMMFFHLALSSGLFLGPLINGYLVQLHSWRWSCGFIAIFAGSLLVVGFFTIRETQYAKQRIQYEPQDVPARKSYVGWLSLTVGYNKEGHFFGTFWDIVRMAAYPPVVWVGVVIGCFVGWFVLSHFLICVLLLLPTYKHTFSKGFHILFLIIHHMLLMHLSSYRHILFAMLSQIAYRCYITIHHALTFSHYQLTNITILTSSPRTIVIQVTTAQTFVKPPWSWSTGDVGIFSISGWIGALISFYFGGRLIDLISNRARKTSHTAKPKPEKRLIALTIPAFIGPLGVITYGQCIAHKTTWVGPAFGFGMHAFALTALSNIAVTYCVDCYQQVSWSSPATAMWAMCS